MAFSKTRTVRFDDVDFARVVYYPNFFGYAHGVFEDFFADELGVPYATLLQQRNVGFPTVHCEADFKAPLRFGEQFQVTLLVERLSQKSVTCQYRFEKGATLCAVLQVVTVPVDMTLFVSVNVPDDVAAAFAKHAVR